MAKYLVVVESPAKAKTIEKYLGKDYRVMASYGHVQDLIPKEGAVDVAHDFSMKYQEIDRNKKHMDAIAKALKTCEGIFLAPDPDREGEAIAWSIKELLEKRKGLKDKTLSRVVFYQITKSAVQEAIANPREIAMDLVHAQQARRALDYLVGFTLSPLLWLKIRPGLSAGRVQSPALRMIVEREEEIEKFISQEYWTIHAEAKLKADSIEGKLVQYKGEKVEQFTFTNEKDSTAATSHIIKVAKGKLEVTKVTKKERKRHPAAPFITATLQQEAARKLGFSAQKTMQIAQQLYEGVEIDEGAVGLITYMRTDSVNVAAEAIAEIREFIPVRFGKENLPEEVRVFKTKSKNAQEAHEAIRPTSILREPDQLKKFLSPDQLKLYQLVWKRTIASQMADAILNTVSIDLSAKDNIFRATGSTIAKPGFISVYFETADDAAEEGEKILPPLKEGEIIDVEKIEGAQHFTEPPPRYSEASLVKALEERDIGRPSTYASIIATLKNREYVEVDNKRFKPTDIGRIVNRFLTNYFTQYVDYGFTANLEDQLDAIARGDQEWIPVLRNFWQPFKDLIDHTKENVSRKDVTQELIEEKCPKCNSPLSIRLGKRGRFIGCTAYPECDYTRNLNEDAQSEPEVIEGRVCPDCESPLLVRHGKFGKFIGCSGYPKCKHMEPLEKPEDTGVQCPKCKQANLFKRKSRRGKIFYSCQRYPDCDYALWDEPLAEACPNCAWPILTLKTTKSRGTEKLCPQRCGFTESV
jgi:DNA topoisomerase-1